MHDYDEDNDGRFPDESPVDVRYPRSKQEEQGDRSHWPWLPGTIVEQCGPDEWYVCVEVRELAVLRDGRRAPRGTASRPLPSTSRPHAVTGPQLQGERDPPIWRPIRIPGAVIGAARIRAFCRSDAASAGRYSRAG